MSGMEFRKFWITWNNKILKFGRNNERTPILSEPISMCNLHYVTFSVLGARFGANWKYCLPPYIEKPLLIKLKGGEPHWVKADQQLPNDALIGGYEGEILYIIRAYYRGSLTPGKFVPNIGSGYVPWGGEMNEFKKFEMLCGYNCTWVKAQGNKIPVGAIEGGYSENGHEILYVGRIEYDGHLIPGKVQPSRSRCIVPYEGREVANQRYEILIVPNETTKYANNFWLSGINHRVREELHDSNDEEEDEGNLYRRFIGRDPLRRLFI